MIKLNGISFHICIWTFEVNTEKEGSWKEIYNLFRFSDETYFRGAELQRWKEVSNKESAAHVPTFFNNSLNLTVNLLWAFERLRE